MIEMPTWGFALFTLVIFGVGVIVGILSGYIVK